MSTNEIIAELPRLSPDELVLIKSKVDEVLKDRAALEGQSFFVSCLEASRAAPDTPADYSENIDAYLYGGKPASQGNG